MRFISLCFILLSSFAFADEWPRPKQIVPLPSPKRVEASVKTTAPVGTDHAAGVSPVIQRIEYESQRVYSRRYVQSRPASSSAGFYPVFSSSVSGC